MTAFRTPAARGLVTPRHPLARLGAAAILMAFVFVTLDGVTAALVLAVLVAVLPFAGVPASEQLRRAWPLLVAAISVGVLNALLAAPAAGAADVAIGPLRVSAGVATGASLAVRLLAIALSAALAVVRLDATELADALVLQLRLPARFAVGALAGVRSVPVFREEWLTLSRARRARGIDAGASPVRRVALFAGQAHALLAGAIRRGLRMASAMDARGFGALPCRTFARERPMRPADWLLLAGALLTGAVATAISVAAGTWRFLAT